MASINLEKIPSELKAHPHWVCWSFEEREGKSTKIPKNPRTGGNAMANDPRTWGEFQAAELIYRNFPKWPWCPSSR
jgi:primase-polymerase (primpol)-like protein